MSTPVKRKITLELNPNKKVLPKDRPSVFQRLGTKKFPLPGGGGGGGGGGSGGVGAGGGPSSSVSSTAASGSGSGQEAILNKEEIVKRIVGCVDDGPPEPVPPPKIVPESVSAHARLIEAQLAAKLGKVIVSRGETIGAPAPPPPAPVAAPAPAPVAPVSSTSGGGGGGSSGRKEVEGIRERERERERERDRDREKDRERERDRGHSSTTTKERGSGGGGGGGGEGWDQSSLENADQDILERKRKELQHELKLEMDASGGGGGGGSSHHHHHHHSSSSSALKQKQGGAKETLTVLKKVRKVPVARRRSSSSSDSSSSSGSDSSDSDSSSSSSSSSRDSRRVKKRTVRQRRGSSSSSEGGPGTKKVIKKHVKKVSADGTKRIVTKKVGGHVTKIRVKKVTSPGGTSHLRKVRDVSPGAKVPTKYTVKKVVAVKKDKLAVVDARERVREKEREMALMRKRELAIKEKVPARKSRSPRSHIRSRSPRSRLSPRGSSRGREMLKKKSPEPVARYREPPAAVVRRERSPDPRLDDRRRHDLKDRERLRERELSRAKEREREEALARQERPRERDRLPVGKERDRGVPPPVPSSSGSVSRGRDIDGGLDKPDRHRPVERLLPRPAERARALAAARSPGKHDHDRSRTPNSPRARDRVPREHSYDRFDHGGHGRRSRSRDREYPPHQQQTIVRGARARDSPYERHPPPAPAAPIREGRDNYREDRGGYDRDRGNRHGDYGRNDYPDDPPPRRDHVERDWGDREPAPPPRSFDRRGPPEEHGSWDRGDHHGPPQHSHGPHDQEPYQGTSRSWDDAPARWKEQDGWVNDKDQRPDWKYKDQRQQWDHDDHPGGHTHNHGGGRPGGRWQGPDQNQGPGGNWHGKPKEDMDFGGPRHKLAGRLGEAPDRGGMFRRHTHQGPPMYHHDRKMDRGGGHMDRGGRGGGRFGPPNRYSINRTQQNLANQQMQHQHEHHHPPPQQMGQGPPMPPCGGMPPNAQLAPQGVEVKVEIPENTEPQQPATAIPDVPPAAEAQPTPQPAEVVAAPTEEVPAPNEGAEKAPDSAAAAPPEPSEAPSAEEGDKPTEAVPAAASAALPAEPMDEDNLSEISDDPDDILTREEEISQLNESAAAAAAAADKLATVGGDPADPTSTESQQDGENSAGGAGPSSGEDNLGQHQQQHLQDPNDPKVAGKLHANKELKKDFETLDFEEISDGELEEENKFKGLGDALGVDWASLAQETRAKLRPETTIPVSARNRWKAHHILLDIGISVRLAGEAYAQRVLTESKEKLREEIQEFKAAAAAARQQKQAVKREEEEQQLFNGVKIKKEVLDEEEQKEAAEKEQQAAVKEEAESAAAEEQTTEQEANLAEMDKILHPVASVHVAMRERARSRRNLILRAAGPCSRALSARRDLEIRRQLCGFPPQECNERITEAAVVPGAPVVAGAASAAANSDLHDAVMKLFQATMQPPPSSKIEVQ